MPRTTTIFNRRRGPLAGAALAGICVVACLAPPTLTLPVLAAAPAPAARPAKGSAPDYGISQVGMINQHIRAAWHDYQLKPSPRASDGEWCRRVHLDIIGRIPSVGELNAFLTDRSADARPKLVAKLLSDQYTEEYARNWTTIWTNILIGRSGGTEPRSMTNRAGMQQYLRRAFLRNKPYDQMVRELVSAEGTSKPGLRDFNGAVNFLAMKLDEKGALATAQTSRIFLGVQVQCTQCHNHPFNEWKQDQFWEMNAFFRQTVALRRYGQGRDIDHVHVTNQDFGGEDDLSDARTATIYYEDRKGELFAAYPTFVDGTELKNRSGYVREVNRRAELAKMIVASDYLDRAIANRAWGHFLGYGFTKPVDDMGPHNRATHPELLAELGKEFRQVKFDMKELIRWIVLSEPYALSSMTTSGNASDDPSLGERPMFSHFYLRQMRAEELYESLLVATEAHKTRGSYSEQEKLKTEWLAQFVKAFGTDEGDETTTFNGTIPQVLMMMNGELINKATSTDQGGFLHRIAADNRLAAADKIRHLYLAALAREPSARELQGANWLLARRSGDTAAALQDVWWVLLNSNAFILNH